ncbi:hypothetical protein [Actinacidiphila glaucinigra]|uniref:hypothetical protein n=1 Tax=Actinacidiphila glaucinigra TaxID=235986 RepID=UPI00370FB713
MTAEQPQPEAAAPARAWVLRRWDRSDETVTLHTDQTVGLAALATHVRGVWNTIAGRDGIPARPPTADRDTVELYYGPDRDARPDEGYNLYADVIRGPGHRQAE